MLQITRDSVGQGQILWLKTGRGSGIFWILWWNYDFHEMRGMTWLAEKLLKQDSGSWSYLHSVRNCCCFGGSTCGTWRTQRRKTAIITVDKLRDSRPSTQRTLYHAREGDAMPSLMCWTSIPLFYKTPTGWDPSAETCRSLILVPNFNLWSTFFVDIC
jgi:hypothetical protein